MPDGSSVRLTDAQHVHAQLADFARQLLAVVAADPVVVADRSTVGQDRRAGRPAWPLATGRPASSVWAQATVKYSDAPAGYTWDTWQRMIGGVPAAVSVSRSAAVTAA